MPPRLFSFVFLSLILSTSNHVSSNPSTHFTSLYFSPNKFFSDYQSMVNNFKIYIYTLDEPPSFTSSDQSLFFSSLQKSSFLTHKPEEAHFFFIPFSSNISLRSISRVIKRLRFEYPYWNRTLGADHFYVSGPGLGSASDRNLLELMKNSVWVSSFPALDCRFVPRKDITLPPYVNYHAPLMTVEKVGGFFVKHNSVKGVGLVNELRKDPDFLIESEPSDEGMLIERFVKSDFCLFEYGADTTWIAYALRFGCVLVVISDRPMMDWPLMDVLRWQEILVLVGSTEGGAENVKRVVNDTCGEDTCEERRRLGVAASEYVLWNETMGNGAFEMIMYQVWLRRHVIRYGRREFI